MENGDLENMLHIPAQVMSLVVGLRNTKTNIWIRKNFLASIEAIVTFLQKEIDNFKVSSKGAK